MFYKICVVGLGYVGLPLAVELAKSFPVVGFDVDRRRVNELMANHDRTDSVSVCSLEEVKISFSYDPHVIGECNFIIIAVPTPVDSHQIPDLRFLCDATEVVGKNLSSGAVVVYESTVYPGATEEICIPVLERSSGLVWKRDFNVGYSPERINPGDTSHTVSTIMKVVSGDTPETLEKIARVYGSAVRAGIFKAASIKVAEAAKVIENTQRDINIALMNELKIIFDKMNISTRDVLKAASTKWNFLPFEPGLVGGHCIGVDPYYLVYKAEELGYHPQIIHAGRRLNDSMGEYFAKELLRKMICKGFKINSSRVLVCGITFKEDVSDIRNSKAVDVIEELESFGVTCDVFDPVADPDDVKIAYGIDLVSVPESGRYDAALLLVKHRFFRSVGLLWFENLLKPEGFVSDIKDFL